MRSSLQPPYAAYLRVYEPLAAFPEPERSHWYEYAAAAEPLPAAEEVRRSLRSLLAFPPVAIPERESDDAFVTVLDGVTHVCPWRTRLRARLALEELEETFPRPLVEAAVPGVVREQERADFERWREKNPEARPWILATAWHVPVRWFVLFAADERDFTSATRAEGVPALRYRTSMTRARQRVARGLKALRETMRDSALVGGLEEVGRWLEEFHPRSLVELDYGGLVHLVPVRDLAEDTSVEEVAGGLAALREGDGAEAGRLYRRLHERWVSVQRMQSAN